MGTGEPLFFSYFSEIVWQWRFPICFLFLLAVLRELRGLVKEAKVHALLMFTYFFLIITCFWILKPIKKALFMRYHQAHPLTFLQWQFGAAQLELVAKELNLVIAILAACLFTALAKKYQRERLAKIVIAFFSFGLALLSLAAEKNSSYTVWTLYLFGDLYVTVMVATFFAFLNDSEEPFSARRIYGLIGLGGVLGGCFGTAVVAKGFASSASGSEALRVCSVLTTFIFFIAMAGGAMVRRNPVKQKILSEENSKKLSMKAFGFVKSVSDVWKSKYLLSIALIVAVYEIVSTLVDYQFTLTVVNFVPSDDLSSYFSEVFFFTNSVALLVQLFLTRLVLVRFGVGFALLVLPFFILLGSLCFLFLPVLLIGSLLNTADNGFSYSINQSAKEVLYVPMSRDKRYRVKAVIDIFVIRLAKAVSVPLGLGIGLLFTDFRDARWLSLVNCALLVFWFFLLVVVKREYDREESCSTFADS